MIDVVIEGRKRDLGGFSVARVLPAVERRMVGPFLFLDQMGPAEFGPGEALDVRPHPHINLATVTYLFEGEIMHRDSVGSAQPIQPGAINWMTAGRGIVHSERTPDHLRTATTRLHGIQLWCALPDEHEETEPAFVHYPADTIPRLDRDGATVRVLAGTAYGLTSPVRTLSRLFYVDVEAPGGITVDVPTGYAERAMYVAIGAARAGGQRYDAGHLVVFAGDGDLAITAEPGARLVFLGGDPVGPRFIEWNFVSSRKERIEEAKRAWRGREFPLVPGDEAEFIPLPEPV